MKNIYYIHGYQSNAKGNKYYNLERYYIDNPEFNTICLEWNENMDMVDFVTNCFKIILNDTEEKILIADSMGGNIALSFISIISELHYIFINPVFSAEQLFHNSEINSEMKKRINKFDNSNLLTNLNGKFIISQYDEALQPEYYKKVVSSQKVILIPEKHSIHNFADYMAMVNEEIVDSFS